MAAVTLTRSPEGYECRIGYDVYRIRPAMGDSAYGWTMTVGAEGGEYLGTVDHFCRLADARAFLADVAAAS